MIHASQVSAIAGLIQLAIAPVFLLAGVGAILNVMASRRARVVDRVRRREADYLTCGPPEQARIRSELERLAARMKLANWAITLCTASALFVCLVVAILFVGGLAEVSFGQMIAVLFILAMAMLTGGLILFLLEVRLAARSLRVHYELIRSGLAGYGAD
jgi:hypothetical protein